MVQDRQSADRFTVLPEAAARFLKRRLHETLGLALIILAFALALAVISYHPGDVSFNTASAGAPANWLAAPGAFVADILLQTLGLASAVLVVVLVAWSWRIVSHRGLPWIWLHVALLPICLLAWAGVLAGLNAPAGWPVRAGLGGVIGLYLYLGLGDLVATLGLSVPDWSVVIGLAATAVTLLVFTLGIAVGEWRGIARGLRWLLVQAGRGLRALAQGLVAAVTFVAAMARRWAAPQSAAPTTRRALKTRTRGRKAAPEPETTSRVAGGPAKLTTGARAAREAQPTLDLEPDGDFKLPALNLLAKPPRTERGIRVNEAALEQNARLLESVLDDFGVHGEIVKVRPGPVVTMYELEPAPGTKSSRVIGLADDVARSMSAVSARVAVVPGRNAIGIELPNAKRETVYLRELLSSPEFDRASERLALALGKDISGRPAIVDLAAMPHLLIAGTTGSGKSVAINTMIMSLIYRLLPHQCRFIMIDPKMLELSVYDGIPHLMTPVVTDPKKAIVALKWAVREMEDRYRAMSKLGVRNIAAFNKRVTKALESGEVLKRTVQTGFDKDTGKPVYEQQVLELKALPLVVIVVDEMADLMMVAGKDVEAAIQRLAQMARAAGIHLITATQRPSVDVITGTIKANFPTRISFQVTSRIDSRTILGEQGAEQLLGQGDMLYMAGGGRITRVHGAFVSDGEVEKVVAHLKAQGAPEYLDAVIESTDDDLGGVMPGLSSGDELYDRAVELVAREQRASTSFIQRHLQIGYNRAARIIERMEKEGVVGQANHVGRREVLVADHSDVV